MKLEIIDIERKGNVVRFYLGKNGTQWGDDWNDAPYEHNAGRVYDEFVKDYLDMNFLFEYELCEPRDGYDINSQYSKEDMIKRKVPCLVIGSECYDTFEDVLADNKTIKIYYGDTMEKLKGGLK